MGWGICYKSKIIVKILKVFKLTIKFDNFLSKISKQRLESQKEDLEDSIDYCKQHLLGLVLARKASVEKTIARFNELIDFYEDSMFTLNKVIDCLEDYKSKDC